MESSSQAVSPLRQRMIDDMRMRKLCDKTQASYIRAVRQLAAFLKRSPDTATAEELRRFQLHMVDRGTSPVTLNATITGLKFFFDVTLDRGELLSKMPPVWVPRTLPVKLSREQVARLIAAAPNLKSQTALSIAYGAGLRADSSHACLQSQQATALERGGASPSQAAVRDTTNCRSCSIFPNDWQGYSLGARMVYSPLSQRTQPRKHASSTRSSGFGRAETPHIKAGRLPVVLDWS